MVSLLLRAWRVGILCWYVPLYLVAVRSASAEAIIRDALRATQGGGDEDIARVLASPGRHRQILRGLAQPKVRSVTYHRFTLGPEWEQLAEMFFSRFMPGLADFEMVCPDLGAGLRIGHGFGDVLWARSIGRDCTIGHQVTLGGMGDGSTEQWADHTPIIGDRILIWANAIVFGPITVGDDAVIGAGAVVNRDVPARAIVAGMPARVIRMRSDDEIAQRL